MSQENFQATNSCCDFVLAKKVNAIYLIDVTSQISPLSPPSARIQRKRLKKQALIVDTAMRLLADGGLGHVTVGRLAAELDYTPGALYRYFPSMEVLLSHMQQRAITSLGARIEQALAKLEPGEGMELERLRVIARCYLDTENRAAREEVGLIGQMLASPTILISTPVAQQSIPALGSLLIRVEGFLSRAQEKGVISPGSSRERAVELWAALQGALSLGKLQRFDATLFDSRRIGLGLVEHLITAWSAQSSSEVNT